MRIHNWPTKALIIVAAAAALWLGLACQNPYPIIIAPSAPCGEYEPGQRLVPSVEFRHFPGHIMHFPDEVDTQEWNRAVEARAERLNLKRERVRAVFDEYRSLIEETVLPIGHAYSRGTGVIATEKELFTDQYFIRIGVDVNWKEGIVDDGDDLSKVASEDRIPECMDGFPVIVRIVSLQPLEEFYPPIKPEE